MPARPLGTSGLRCAVRLLRSRFTGGETDDEKEETVDDGLGKGFWLKLMGGILLVGLAIFVGFVIFDKLLWGLGFFGALLFIVAILVVVAWLYDRHQQTSYRTD